jgi:hypothetical protein
MRGGDEAQGSPLGPSLGQPAASKCASKGSIRDRSPERVSPAVSSGCNDDLMTPRLADRASICGANRACADGCNRGPHLKTSCGTLQMMSVSSGIVASCQSFLRTPLQEGRRRPVELANSRTEGNLCLSRLCPSTKEPGRTSCGARRLGPFPLARPSFLMRSRSSFKFSSFLRSSFISRQP